MSFYIVVAEKGICQYLVNTLTRLNLVWDHWNMPARNTVKIYHENTYYHVYNRGVEGRNIFEDDKDYKVFLSFIKRYLTKPSQNEVQPRWQMGIGEEVQLSAYCLMPNHFHLLLKQKNSQGMTRFVRALMNSYVRYFNLRHKRVGGLFQGIYKAIPIDTEAYILHLTRYIHLNPLDLEEMTFGGLEDYYCSYGEYIGKRNTNWLQCHEILGYFGSKLAGISRFKSYKEFVEKYQGESGEVLGKLVLE